EFTVGGSLQGNIPFAPTDAPSALTGTSPFFGHVTAKAGFGLGDLPVGVTGNVVIDLDANDDGKGLAVDRTALHDLVTGHETFADFARAAAGDVAVGANGSAALNYAKTGFDFTLGLGGGSVVYTPGRVAFRGRTTDP